jgi:hypothetical protein
MICLAVTVADPIQAHLFSFGLPLTKQLTKDTDTDFRLTSRLSLYNKRSRNRTLRSG